ASTAEPPDESNLGFKASGHCPSRDLRNVGVFLDNLAVNRWFTDLHLHFASVPPALPVLNISAILPVCHLIVIISCLSLG
ncbi:hypothetical protein HAX54_021383, partial [Datura stramonium]|nr:hypothetical protein [Datura stramonium]